MKQRYSKILILILLILAASNAFAQQIKGVVTDSVTHEPLMYISVYYQEKKDMGTITNIDGEYSLEARRNGGTLVFSAVGYISKTVKVSYGNQTVNVQLAPDNVILNEVVVKPKKEKYSRKNNPAVEFMKKVIEHKKAQALEVNEYYQYDKYEKMKMSINDLTPEKLEKGIYKKYSFLRDQVEVSETTNKLILPISVQETASQTIFRKDPESKKTIIKGKNSNGIEEFFSTGDMLGTVLKDVFADINIYDDEIRLLQQRFVSPIGSNAISFYKYYLMDTLQIAGEPCVDLAFTPFNSESFGFNGHLYVVLDSTYFVKRAVFNFPKKINLNFVDYMLLEQEFKRAEDGTRLLDHESITVEFKLTEGQDGIFARRVADYSNYTFAPTAEADKAFTKPERIIEETEALTRSESFWAENRPEAAISQQENSVDHLMAQLRSYPVYYWTEKVLSILFTGYIPTSKEAPLFYIGPMNATISGNTLEGPRIRAGGMTTAWLNPHLFAKGYIAYGFKDERVKGLAELEYSFKKKKEYANEFPIHSLKLRYESDVNQYGQNYLYTSKDNVFLALKREKDDRIGYFKQAEMTYTNEFYSGFSFQLTARRRTDESSYLIPFLRKEGDVYTPVKDFSTSAAELKLRYAPNEKFFQTQWNRFPVSLDAPVFTLSHTIAGKGILGSDYTYNHTEAGIQKRFWFSAFGYTDIILKAGKVWDKVPFPLLIMPNANLSYTIQPESYSLMNAMEFMNDEYFSWDVTYFLNGWLFNRIPLLKKLKWREVVSCRGLYGHLSDKNNPVLSDGLFAFPIANTQSMGKTPYVEAGIGIENILKVLRLDYVWRLTYRDAPGIDKSGLRISLHMTF